PELPLGVLLNRVRDLDVLALHVQTHRASSLRVADESTSNLSDRAGEADDLDLLRACSPQGLRGGAGSRSGRVDVVNKANGLRHLTGRAEDATNIAAALDEGETALPAGRALAHEQRRNRQLPAVA